MDKITGDYQLVREKTNTYRRVAPYTPTRSCVHIGVLKKKKKKQNWKNKE
jgi:hypothetical protein